MAKENSRRMKLSTILPNYQHFNVTKAHVREVMNSAVLPDEIVVVNDCGDPALKEILKTLEKKTKIIYAYILPPKIEWNYNGSVNLGVWLSKGDYLAIEDNDNIPMPDLYGKMIESLNARATTGRCYSFKRLDIEAKDLEKPASEWKVISSRGPNQGSYMIKRELYTKLKGQDEKMCGQYGWMYYDWKNRMLKKAKTEFGQAGNYWYVVDGQTELSRRVSSKNYQVYRQNARSPDLHSDYGILNFKFTVEEL
jgi:glycosyltransferase involved in cell wall biosynthesis